MSLLIEGQTRKILVTLAFGSLTGLDKVGELLVLLVMWKVLPFYQVSFGVKQIV